MNKLNVNVHGQNIECTIEAIDMDPEKNTATLKVRGISKHNVTTVIPIDNLMSFMDGKEVKSVYGYFTVYLKDPSTINALYEILEES